MHFITNSRYAILNIRSFMELKIDTHNESAYGFIFHYYRAEVYRETNWRNRLDVTSNWAIVVTAGILSFVFTEEKATHTVILVNFLLVWFFLYIESRRFRYYMILKDRTRLLEKHIFSDVFSGKKVNIKNMRWTKELIDSFHQPKVTMSRIESISWRLRRSYLLIFPILFLAWLAKIQSSPIKAVNLGQMLDNARLWFVPGWLVFYGFLLAVITTVIFALYLPERSDGDDLP